MVYELVDQYDPLLTQKTQRFDFDNPPIDPVELFENMRDTLVANQGVGLACPQVGLPYRMFVMGHHSVPDEIMAVFNPTIVDYSGEEYTEEEGCLTFPGLFIKIKRHMNIRVRMAIENGVTDTINLDGFAARIFQHEYDHLEGVLYQKRANRYHLDLAKKQKVKLDRMRKKNARSAAA